MSIYFQKEDREIPDIEKDKIVEAISLICKEGGKSAADINFVYCSDEFLLDMNKEYLDHDFYTDIITFNYNEGDIISGDIFMSKDRIEENAKKFGENLKKEFTRICAHGILHLLGFEDGSEEEKELMRKKEEEFIKIVLG